MSQITEYKRLKVMESINLFITCCIESHDNRQFDTRGSDPCGQDSFQQEKPHSSSLAKPWS